MYVFLHSSNKALRIHKMLLNFFSTHVRTLNKALKIYKILLHFFFPHTCAGTYRLLLERITISMGRLPCPPYQLLTSPSLRERWYLSPPNSPRLGESETLVDVYRYFVFVFSFWEGGREGGRGGEGRGGRRGEGGREGGRAIVHIPIELDLPFRRYSNAPK